MVGADPIKSSVVIAIRRPIIKRAAAARAAFAIVSPLISGIRASPYCFLNYAKKGMG